MSEVGKATLVLDGDATQFEKVMARAEKDFAATGKKLQKIGDSWSKNFTAPMLAAASGTELLSTKFETSLTKIETLVGISADQIQDWRDDILSLAGRTARAPQELADALFVVTSAGARGAEAMSILTGAAKASASGLGETKDIARTVTAAMQAYGSENLSAAEALDVMTATVREGNLEASELAGSLGKVLGLTSQAGVSFDQAGAFIATFTRLGVSASEAVTGLRGVLAAVVRPTDTTREGLKALGMTVDDLRSAIRERGLTAALNELVQKAGDNTDALGKVVPEVEALAGVLGTAGAQGEEFTKIQANIADSLGILDSAFQRTTETRGFKFQQFLTDLKTLGIEVGDELAPAFTDLLESGRDVARWAADAVKVFAALPSPVKSASIAFLALGAAVGPVLSVSGRVLQAASSLSGGMVRLAGGYQGVVNVLPGFLTTTKMARNELGQFTGAVRILRPELSKAALAFAGPAGLIAGGVALIAMNRDARTSFQNLATNVRGLTGNVLELNGMAEAAAKRWMESKGAMAQWLPVAQKVRDTIVDVRSWNERQIDAMQEANSGWLSWADALYRWTGAMSAVRREWSASIPILGQLLSISDEFTQHQEKQAAEARRGADAVAAANRQLDKIAEAGQEVGYRFQLLNGVMTKVFDRAGNLGGAVLKANLQLERMAAAGNEVGFRYEDVDGVLRKVDKTTGELIEPVSKAKDAFEKLAAAFDSLGVKTARDLKPSLDALELAVQSGQAPVVQLESKWKGLYEQYQELGLLTPAVIARLGAIGAELDRQGESARAAAAGVKDVMDNWEKAARLQQSYAMAVSRQSTSLERIRPPLDYYNDQLVTSRDTLQELWLAQGGWTNAMIKSTPEFKMASEALQEYFDWLAAIEGMFPGLKKKTDEAGGGFLGLGNIIDGLVGGLKDLWKGMSGGTGKFSGFLKKIGGGISQELGRMITGGLTSAIQYGVSKLAGLFGGLISSIFKKANVKDHVAKYFGLELSEGLTKAIEDMRSQTGGDIEAAFRMMLGDVIREVGIDSLEDLRNWVQQVHNTLADLDRGNLTSAQAMSAMSDSVAELIAAFQELGGDVGDLSGITAIYQDVLNRVTLGQIDAADAAALLGDTFGDFVTAAMALGDEGSDTVLQIVDAAQAAGISLDFLRGQFEDLVAAAAQDWDVDALAGIIDLASRAGVELTNLKGIFADAMAAYRDMVVDSSQKAIDGITALFEAVHRKVEVVLDDGTKKMVESWSIGARMGEFAAETLQASFEQLRAAGVPLADILEMLGGQVDILTDNMRNVPPELQQVDQLFDVLSGQAAKSVEKLDAVAHSMEGLDELGRVSASTLDFFGDSIDRAFNKLTMGGATSEEALSFLGPQLRELIDMSDKYGLFIDHNTQALIDQADAAGLLPPAVEPVEDIFSDIRSVIILLAEALGVDVPEAIKKAADAAQNEFGKAKSAAQQAFFGMAESAGLNAKDAREYWRRLSPDLRQMFNDAGDISRKGFLAMAVAAGNNAREARRLWRESGGDIAAILNSIGDQGESGNKKVGDSADRESQRAARQFRVNITDKVLPILRRFGDVGEQQAQRVGAAFVQSAQDAVDWWAWAEDQTIGHSSILDIGEIGMSVADRLGSSHMAAAAATAAAWSGASDTMRRQMRKASAAVSAVPSSLSTSLRVASAPLRMPVPPSSPAATGFGRAGGGADRSILDELRALRREQEITRRELRDVLGPGMTRRMQDATSKLISRK